MGWQDKSKPLQKNPKTIVGLALDSAAEAVNDRTRIYEERPGWIKWSRAIKSSFIICFIISVIMFFVIIYNENVVGYIIFGIFVGITILIPIVHVIVGLFVRMIKRDEESQPCD
jgi:hypothetical protein